MSGLFAENLEKLDFYPSTDEERSVLLVSQKELYQNLSPVEIFALQDAEKFKATAVYFRHFPDERPPLPQIYLYDNTENNLSEDILAVIHRDLWSNARIPMFIVIEKTDVKIFDTRKPVIVLGEVIKPAIVEKISIADDAIKQYSRKLFDSGIFWESEKARGHFLESTSAYSDFIDNLKHIRKEFLKIANLPPKVAHKILVFSILIKYLEERGNENESLFAQDFFQQFDAKNFCDVLRQKGKITALFDELSRHFNGRIFEWANVEERRLVENSDLEQLAYFLDGNSRLETGQLFFDWRKYSFNNLPVELISSVYEELLNERKDAVYTPEFLVNTLIDESMPQKEYAKLSVKTIDVSCGSGIFLVSAFKKLAQRHRYAEFKKTGKLNQLKSKKLLEIIKDNIFGIDIEDDAVRLTVFSLCLALCDELTPKEIWTELKFDDTFQTNFKTANFFEYVENEINFNEFDLVIGNPPFISLSLKKDENGIYFGEYSEKSSEGKIERKKINLNKDIIFKSQHQIYPDNQTALMFLDQAPRLLKENGLLCLIMPSAPLLYNNPVEFRKHFFPKYQISQILDFTNLDAILFEADVPTAAIFLHKQEHNEEKIITHITIRRTKSIEDKIFFEIDKYDFHYVSQQEAINDKHVWKCNLLGGGRVHNLIRRLSYLPSVKDFVEANEWIYGAGYQIGSIDKQYYDAPYITRHPSLPTTALTEEGIDENQIFIETAEKFHRISDERIFTPPHLLIKTNIGKDKIPTYFSDKYLTFKKVILGISASENNRNELLELSESFEKNKSVYRFIIATTSNKYLVSRATATINQDILNLPYPEDKDELQLSYIEQMLCDDVLQYYIQIKAKNDKAKMNANAKTEDLKRFGEVFSKALNSIYEETNKCFHLKKIYDWDGFYITEFNYGKNTEEIEIEKINEPTDHIKSLIELEYSRNAYLIKILKLYERNKVYFIKPKTLRYWLRSIAVKDADEVFSDSIKQTDYPE